MIRIELKRRWINDFGKEYPIGTVLPMSGSLADRLISSGVAKKYSGKYPPKKKVKTEFFKPKD